ncbi:protein kinase [Streptomyces sp. NPDC050560]|uniref:protein kinase domain-containing protein n=1 Tax=Streptomyces sp. NPDC050560 TaxID=3365630 RepID=UPI0037AB9014
MLLPLTHDDPDRMADYRLIARLGGGGMGTVYLGRSAAGRTVALKTMHARIAADAAARTRFRLETDAARVIGHHGAHVFDADPAAPVPWLATEYVLGPPLGDAVAAHGVLPEAAVRGLGAALCAALAQLHSSDVVHRDLKPSNIMVTADGPRLIDFGIAHAIGDARLTRTGAAAGTPAFMSPEQAMGQEHTAAGDVFALAGVLVYAATGHGPFGAGQAADLLYRVRYSQPDLTGLPPALAPLLAPCFDKDPARRPTTHGLAAWLAAGDGPFADLLPEPLLGDIARRATDVWRAAPYRLPPPADGTDGGATTAVAAPRARMSRRRLLTLGGGSVLAAAAVGGGAWAWAGGSSGGPKAPDAVWRVTYDAVRAGRRRPPVVVGGILLVDGGDAVRALDASTGEAAWQSPALVGSWRAAAGGGRLYALAPPDSRPFGMTVSSVDLGTGALNSASAVTLDDWAGGIRNERLLCVSDSRAFVVATPRPKKDPYGDGVGGDGAEWTLHALDLTTGESVWQEPLGKGGPDGLTFLSAAVNDTALVVCGENADGPYTACYGADAGGRNWSARVPAAELRDGASALAADTVHAYFGGASLRARPLTDQGQGWTYPGGSGGYGAPALDGGVVYATEATGGGALVAAQAATGRPLWRERPKDHAAPLPDVAPMAGDAYLYVATRTGLAAIDRDSHRRVWELPAAATSWVLDRATKRLYGVGRTSAVAFPLE